MHRAVLASPLATARAYAAGGGPEFVNVERALQDPMSIVAGSGFVPGPAGADLMAALWALSIVGRLQGLRRVPLQTRLISEDTAVSASFVDEAAGIPVHAEALTYTLLDAKPKIGAIAVVTRELMESSDPAALDMLRARLARAGAACDALVDAGSTLDSAAWVLRPRSAAFLARLRGTGGALAHLGLTAKGGTLLGLPALTSAAVPLVDSKANISPVDAGQIWVAQDVAEVLVSTRGTVQPDGDPPDSATTAVSLWQHDLAGVRLLLRCSWRLARTGAAQLIDGVTY